MAKRTTYKSEVSTVPKSLKDHLFYGLKMDDEQRQFRDAIWSPKNIIIFCNAPSGTGKTTITVATANLLCEFNKYSKITYCVSPYAEQKQGFLPGGLEQKSAPYFPPLSQALIEIGVDPMRAIGSGDLMAVKNGAYIECVTHTYLRGYNFKDQIVIIDEAQNYTISELKKTLTRCNDGCKIIVIGHDKQIDIPNKSMSGFKPYVDWYRDMPYAQICDLHKNYRGLLSARADELPNT